MSIAICINGWDQAPWLEQFRAALPHHQVELLDDVTDPASIRFAMAWKPEPGVLASLPNLEVIFSLGAGVDFLLMTQAYPMCRLCG